MFIAAFPENRRLCVATYDFEFFFLNIPTYMNSMTLSFTINWVMKHGFMMRQ